MNGLFSETRREYVFLAAAKVGGIQANSTRPVEFIALKLIQVRVDAVHGLLHAAPKQLAKTLRQCHSIVAAYAGDADTSASASAPMALTSQLATTSTAVTSSSSPSVVETTVTLRTKVTGNGGTPTGTVSFFADGKFIGSSTLDVSGGANVRCSALTVGIHSITAMYTGDGNDQASTSPPITRLVGSI